MGWRWWCFGMLFGVLCKVLVMARVHFHEIDGWVLWGCCLGGRCGSIVATGCLGRSSGGAVGGAGVHVVFCYLGPGVYAGVMFVFYFCSWHETKALGPQSSLSESEAHSQVLWMVGNPGRIRFPNINTNKRCGFNHRCFMRANGFRSHPRYGRTKNLLLRAPSHQLQV